MGDHGSRLLFSSLRRLGYVEGRNLVIERYSAEGQAARLSILARQAVERNPDLIIAIGDPVAHAFATATDTIPIIATFADSVSSGLVQSLARPGSRFGVAPVSCAVDANHLYVTLAGMNAVAVLDHKRNRVLSLIPTGWMITSTGFIERLGGSAGRASRLRTWCRRRSPRSCAGRGYSAQETKWGTCCGFCATHFLASAAPRLGDHERRPCPKSWILSRAEGSRGDDHYEAAPSAPSYGAFRSRRRTTRTGMRRSMARPLRCWRPTTSCKGSRFRQGITRSSCRTRTRASGTDSPGRRQRSAPCSRQRSPWRFSRLNHRDCPGLAAHLCRNRNLDHQTSRTTRRFAAAASGDWRLCRFLLCRRPLGR